MKKYNYLHLLLFIPFFLAAETGIISGTVKNRDTNSPLSGVILSLQDIDFETKSDDSGRFIFSRVPAGIYKLKAEKPGLKTVTVNNVVVEADAETVIEIGMVVEKEPHYSTNNLEKSKTDQATPESKKVLHNRRKHPSKDQATETVDPVEIPPPPPLETGTDAEVKIAPPKKLEIPHHAGLKAGFADDNQQYNYFLNFLETYKSKANHYPLKVQERIHLRVLDQNKKSLPNARIDYRLAGKTVLGGQSYADGSFFIYPQEITPVGKNIQTIITYQNQRKEMMIVREGPRDIEVIMDLSRQEYSTIPLDLLFILDATGSMGEEIERLKTTIEIINLNLLSLNIKPAIRYGMVLYRDRDDDFVTKVFPFTGNLPEFHAFLKQVKAEGGGDDPEDLQAALKDALHDMEWSENGLRLAFIITDAPAHLDYGQKYTYVHAAREAKQKAIKLFSIGTGGLDIHGEYQLRQIAQYTYGKYIFLTYGEQGESDGGKPGSVSHHTGSNYQTDKLEAIIIRLVKEELAHLSAIELEIETSYFQATKMESEDKDVTLQKLFTLAINELVDYSSMSIRPGTKVSIIPLIFERESLANNAEYYTEQLHFALARHRLFELIERKNFQYIAREIGLQLSGLVDIDDAARIGSFVGAEMLIIGNVFFKDKNYEVYLKLVRVQTAEILSVTRMKIDYHLGL